MSTITKYRTCNLCEALCGLEIEVKDNKAVSIRGDKKDPFSQGHICPKALALKDLHEDPDRLKFPIQKINGKWEQISWETAFQTVAKKLVDTQEQHGMNSVGMYQGNPSIHNLGTSLFSPFFLRSLKTINRFSATSVDQLAHHLAAVYMFGNPNLIPVPDINRTDFWVIMGGNPLVSNGSLMTAPNVSGKLRAIQKRGGKVIVIDPRRTETANKADQHLFVKPGTDVWLILAMIQQIFERKALKIKHIENIIDKEKLTQIEAATARFTPILASEITGIPVTDILQLTTEYLAASSAAFYGRLGVSAAQHGGLCHWAINILNILTGNFDVSGGAMIPNPAVNVSGRKPKQIKFGRWFSRKDQLPEFGGELPATTMADEILEPGAGQIKAMITSCGNPVLSVPNGRNIDKAFEKLDFMVSIDIYLNETTRHSDIILPPATGLETPHYGMFFHNLAVHDAAKYSEPSVEKEAGTKYDWEIFNALTAQIAIERAKRAGTTLPELPKMTLETNLDAMLRSGKSGLTLAELKKYPHGIDLGPMKSNIAQRLLTDDKKIDIFPTIYQQALAKLETPNHDNQLLLIGRRHLRSNNSWLHNSYRMVKGRERCTALINPIDANHFNIKNGHFIKVTSRVGQVSIKAEVSDEVGKGTISIPHGWGHNRKGIKMQVAADHAGVSMNDLVDDKLVDSLSGVAVINGIPVTVEA